MGQPAYFDNLFSCNLFLSLKCKLLNARIVSKKISVSDYIKVT